MSEWKVKRFWKAAQVAQTDTGFSIRLDSRPVRTPAKVLLEVPTEALAEAVAAEWDAQSDAVNPATMPVTRAANAAIDKVAVQFGEVAGMLAAYGDSDLTCYRAAEPWELAERQAAAWNPLLDWAADHFGARLIPRVGVIHQPQSEGALGRLAAPLRSMNAFELTAMHDLVSLSGSLIIGLAASENAWPVGDLWKWSRIDEDWQVEQWGKDEEASAQALQKADAFRQAARFLALAR